MPIHKKMYGIALASVVVVCGCEKRQFTGAGKVQIQLQKEGVAGHVLHAGDTMEWRPEKGGVKLTIVFLNKGLCEEGDTFDVTDKPVTCTVKGSAESPTPNGPDTLYSYQVQPAPGRPTPATYMVVVPCRGCP